MTVQRFYRYPRIVLSDHVDYEGILRMIEHCKAEHVVFYHGYPSKHMKQENWKRCGSVAPPWEISTYACKMGLR